MTVKEMIDILSTYPDDMLVVIAEHDYCGYVDASVSEEKIKIKLSEPNSPFSQYQDYSSQSNPGSKPQPIYAVRIH